MLQIIKNQESTKKDIQKTIQDEAKDISNKIDDTDEKIQQVQENTEQIQDSANMIEKDIKNMRDDIQDHHYNTNQHLRRIQYQNNQLYQLAASSLKRQHSTPIRYPQPEIEYYSPQPAITYSATNSPPRSSRSERNSQHRRSITRRSVAMNQEQIIYDDTYSTPTKGRWLDKFGM